MCSRRFSCLESQNKYISLYKVINHAKIIGIGFDNINGVNSTYQPVRIGGILGHGKIRGFERVSNHGEIYSTSEIASIYQVRIGGVFAEIIGFDGSSNLRHNIYNKGKITIRNVTPSYWYPSWGLEYLIFKRNHYINY